MGLQIYGMIALAIAGTSYITLFRPAIKLYEEIIEQKTLYSSWIGFTCWNIVTFIFAPGTAYMLLQNDNETFIQDFAIRLATKELEEDEEDDA